MTTFFHASARGFFPGEVLLPPTNTGVKPNCVAGRPTSRVYMSVTLDEAEEWAHFLMHLSHNDAARGNPVHIYEVSPSGRVYDKYLDDMDVVEFHAASATVLAKRCTITNTAR